MPRRAVSCWAVLCCLWQRCNGKHHAGKLHGPAHTRSLTRLNPHPYPFPPILSSPPLLPGRSAKRLLAAEQPGVRLHKVTTQPHMVPAEGTAALLLCCFTAVLLYCCTAPHRHTMPAASLGNPGTAVDGAPIHISCPDPLLNLHLPALPCSGVAWHPR